MPIGDPDWHKHLVGSEFKSNLRMLIFIANVKQWCSFPSYSVVNMMVINNKAVKLYIVDVDEYQLIVYLKTLLYVICIK